MSAPVVPDNLKQHPLLGQWLDVGPCGDVRAFSGKVEIGQGISHALRLIVAEELQLAPAQVTMVRPTTALSPDEAVTSGSLSVQHSGLALRYAAAHLRETCRAALARRQGAAPEAATLHDGVFTCGGASASYHELLDARMLLEPIDPRHLHSRNGRASALGHEPRSDIARKVFGEFEFINDMELPGMLHGRVFRPKTLHAALDSSRWPALEAKLLAIAGVTRVVRDGSLVGVLALAAHTLEKATLQLDKAALWSGGDAAPGPRDVADWLRAQPLETTSIVEPVTDGAAAPVRVFRAEFGRAYLQHASIGLCCAIAQWQEQQLQVWSHSQGIFNLRRDLALAFKTGPEAVTVCHADAAGCYGHNGADDVAFDAAWLALQAQGRPVRVEWTRAQEMGHCRRQEFGAFHVNVALSGQPGKSQGGEARRRQAS